VEKLQTLAAAQSGRHELDSDLLRLKGKLLSGLGNSIAAQQCFQEAVNIACCRSAKTFELTATAELARLVAQKGSCNEAYMMLNEIYDWFTEGFDTRHLKEAKALLDKLHS
jgi:predicted ATPase